MKDDEVRICPLCGGDLRVLRNTTAEQTYLVHPSSNACTYFLVLDEL